MLMNIITNNIINLSLLQLIMKMLKNSCFVFRGQMISQEDYNFIYQFDNANSETKSAMLKEAGPQVPQELSPLNMVFQFFQYKHLPQLKIIVLCFIFCF